jgi:hypothetical protein
MDKDKDPDKLQHAFDANEETPLIVRKETENPNQTFMSILKKVYSMQEIQCYAVETFCRPQKTQTRLDVLGFIRAIALLWVLATHTTLNIPKKSTSSSVLLHYADYGFQGFSSLSFTNALFTTSYFTKV